MVLPRALSKSLLKHSSLVLSKPYSTHSLKLSSSILDIHPEVQHALSSRQPVVALETALVTNGISPPTNLEIARKLEGIIRKQGAVPATIGIVEGRVKVGLRDEELVRLADTEGNRKLVKVSRRDIGPIISERLDGGTTICATLIFAHLAGIRVFATGGLGGVHRGAQDSMDISADLHELTRCPVGVVSCGVKSILDIGRTLEYLETLGVPVVTYGDTYNFPAFFCGKSDFETNWKVNNARAAAEILDAQARLGLQNGTLFAVPMPEEYAAQGEEVKKAVDQAIRESEENGMSKKGKEVTPWLLARVVELTGGKSLQNNLALIENTAVIGGQVAVELAKLQEQQRETSSRSTSASYSSTTSNSTGTVQNKPPKQDATSQSSGKAPAKLVVIGAAAVDITGRVSRGLKRVISHTTAPGTVELTVGGVARNIAEAAHRVLSSGSNSEDRDATLLVSPIGEDAFAPFLLDEHQLLGMRSDGFIPTSESRTAVCDMVLDASGALVGGVADMDIVPMVPEQTVIDRLGEENPSLVVVDGNLSPTTMSSILKHCWSRSDPIPSNEPTSISKSTSILPGILDHLMTSKKDGIHHSPVTYAAPNTLELAHMYREANSETRGMINHRVWWEVLNNFNLGSEWRMDLEQLARRPACPIKDKGDLSFLLKDGIAQMAVNLLPFFQNLVIKCGERGVVVVMRICGEDVDSSAWMMERSNPLRGYIVAKGLEGREIVILKHFPAIPMENDEIVSVTGAGDSLVGALSASLIKDPTTFLDPAKLNAAMQLAQKAAVLSLHSIRAVSPLLGEQAEAAASGRT
ncbi:uncharacterized protein FOMMEDRAFT_133422 [Fomitiporia mediterranea MF3/22]|uniref:uncharacterized protein n=1 Tax=Fomitiporia mediterranea (strain MF3/22) TaxID=694068 RepID=UPI0004407C95|nr:uncharacterized protein FOMMEDRAFT_133422 [Fomitiporia mediterranea MF3/22]EJD04074.1 hypothetical protein FOMMEDRAFT_133422 [Fomitiporia mediterranea MF3/22]